MAEAPSSLPPLKTNKGKYGLVLLIFIGTCTGGWLYMRASEEPQPEPVAEAPEPPPPPREQFAPEIEIPEEEEPESPAEEPKKPTEPSRRPAEVECNGTLTAAQIRNVINGPPRKQVQTCYEQRLKDNNLLQGQMKVLLTIAPSGGVRNVQVSGSLRDAQVYSCVKRVARTWKFPKPEGGCVRTQVPFTMTPKL